MCTTHIHPPIHPSSLILSYLGIERWVLRPHKTYALSIVISESLIQERLILLKAILKSQGLWLSDVQIIPDPSLIIPQGKLLWIMGRERVSWTDSIMYTPALSTLLIYPKLKKQVFEVMTLLRDCKTITHTLPGLPAIPGNR